LTAKGISSDSILVSWHMPVRDKLNGYMQGYNVCILRAPTGSADKDSYPTAPAEWSETRARCVKVIPDILNGEKGSRLFNNLPKFTKYYIRVLAYNQVGNGPPAFTFARTLEDVPWRPPSEGHSPKEGEEYSRNDRTIALYTRIRLSVDKFIFFSTLSP
jgi:hypothetical protein